MPQITLILTDEEYQKYLDGLAAAQSLNYEKKKILIIFSSPGGYSIPMVRAPLPDNANTGPGSLLDGYYSPEHRRFYKEVMGQVYDILKQPK